MYTCIYYFEKLSVCLSCLSGLRIVRTAVRDFCKNVPVGLSTFILMRLRDLFGRRKIQEGKFW